MARKMAENWFSVLLPTVTVIDAMPIPPPNPIAFIYGMGTIFAKPHGNSWHSKTFETLKMKI